MASLPPHDLPSLDQPLTVPLLVRGSFGNPLFIALLSSSFLYLIRCVLAGVSPSPDRTVMAYSLGISATCLILGMLLLTWLRGRRRWLAITIDGFVVTCPGGQRLVYTLDNVMGIRIRERTRMGGRVNHLIYLELVGDRGQELLDCSYVVEPHQPDPLSGFWTRLIQRMADRLRVRLQRGARMEGDGWHLDRDGLHWSGRVITLEQIARIEQSEAEVIVWSVVDGTEWLRLPSHSRNILPLAVFLRDSITPRAEEAGRSAPAKQIRPVEESLRGRAEMNRSLNERHDGLMPPSF